MMNQKLAKLVRTTAFDVFLSVLSIAMTALIGVILYWHFQTYEVLDWKIDKYEMVKEEYVVGEPLTFRTAFCKEGDYEARMALHIEDGVRYIIPQKITKSPEGCFDFVSASVTTPNLSTGEYKLEAVITYRVNPVKEITYTIESNTFKIINE